MRDLTQDEIDNAPEWATHYFIGKGSAGCLCFEGVNRAVNCINGELDGVMFNEFGFNKNSKPIPRKETTTTKTIEFDFTEYVFECTRLKNDTEKGDETIGFYTPYETSYLSRNDAIAIAKYFGLIK